MTIKLLTIGKTDNSSLEHLIGIYHKRLGHYIHFEMEALPDIKKTKNLTVEQQKNKEGELVLKKLGPIDVLFLFDEGGKAYTSMEFADFLQKKMNAGTKQLVFLVGGPYGFSNALYKRAMGKISLSKMTFSHQMVRLFITEQLYRAFTILKNEPYHHQ
jgi:23S rRNA (pseudouridine1915-N3)-methyltransferase